MKISVYANGHSTEGVQEYFGYYYIFASSNPYTKLSIDSYFGLEYVTNSNYPQIQINGTVYKRPSIGTIYNIKDKEVQIIAISNTNNWTSAGIRCILSN